MIEGAILLGSKKINLKKKIGEKKFSKIYKKTGIKILYESGIKETALTLALRCCKKLSTETKSKIDGLLFISQSHDSTIPPSSCILQNNLNLKKNCFAMDIVQGCSAFPYALITASSLLKKKIVKNIAIVSSETYRKYINKKDLITGSVFSDAASVLCFNEKNNPEILSSFFLTDGSGANNLCLKKNKKLFMHGSHIFTFTNYNVPIAVNNLLKNSGLKINDIELFIFHQASKVVLNSLRKKLKIPVSKFYNNLENVGNTVSSSIPMGIIDLIKQKKFPKKKPVLMIGFGVGYSLCGGIFYFG